MVRQLLTRRPGYLLPDRPFPTQNWNAAFGALYLTNVNWDFFQFGKAKERTMVASGALDRDLSDLDQERFQQGIRGLRGLSAIDRHTEN